MNSIKTMLLGAFLTGALIAPAMAQEPEAAPADGKGQPMMSKAFDEADANKDGALDVEEFLIRHREKFKEIDADGNGKLSAEEFKSHAEVMREKYKERREKMGHRDGNGAEPAEPAATDEKPAE